MSDHDDSNKSTTAPARTTTSNPKRISHPPNEYMLYHEAKQREIVAQNNLLKSDEVPEVVISRMWLMENEQERTQWRVRADRLKLKHMQDYPDYYYQPEEQNPDRHSCRPNNLQLPMPLPSPPSSPTISPIHSCPFPIFQMMSFDEQELNQFN